MNWRHIFSVYRKELRDSLRDRRTVVSTLVIPTVAMPLLMGIVSLIAVSAIKKTKSEIPQVMIVGAADSPKLVQDLKADARFQVVPTTPDWQEAIANKQIRAAIEVPDDFDDALAKGRTSLVKIRNYEGEMASGFAVGELSRFFEDRRRITIVERLRDRNISEEVITPFQLQVLNVAPPEKVGGNLIGGMLPYLALMLCFSGAMYPAMDLTAGEKERGTLETILSSPIARLDLVVGKFLLVLTAALTTVFCSLVSMAVSISFFAARMAGAGSAPGINAPSVSLPSLHLGGIAGCFALLFPIALFGSALLMAIAINARTMKEAQSYISPLFVAVIIPSMISLLPGIDLNFKLALVPLLNVSLVSKQMISGEFNWGLIVLVFAVCCVYAGLAIAWCARQFNREAVLFRT